MNKRKQQNLINRSRRKAESIYWWRREGVGEGFNFLAPVPAPQKDHLHDLAIITPFRWQVLAIVYFKGSNGVEYREMEELTSHQQFASNGQGIVPFLEEAIKNAESRGNPKHITSRATVFKPASQHWPDIYPVLSRLKTQLSLSDEEIISLALEGVA